MTKFIQHISKFFHVPVWCALGACVLVAGIVSAASPLKLVYLWWTHSSTPVSELSGYTVYAGTKPNALVPKQQVDYVDSTAVPLPNGTWYIAVVARNKQGIESDFSNVVSAKLPNRAPPLPTNITRIRIHGDQILLEVTAPARAWVGISASDDMKTWSEPTLWQSSATGQLVFGFPINGPKKFFRAVAQ